MKAPFARLFLMFIAALLWTKTSASAQQSIAGNCNVQLGPGASGNAVVLICLPDKDTGGNGGRSVRIATEVDGLMAGSRRFDVVLRNLSSAGRAELSPGSLDLSDSHGRVYDLDCFVTACAERYTLPPEARIRLAIALKQPIAGDAGTVRLTLGNIWAATSGADHLQSLGAVSWDAVVAGSDSDRARATMEAELLREELALGLTQGQRRSIQAALAAKGYDPGPADGMFGPRTRRAIAAWQRDNGHASTGFFGPRQTMSLTVLGMRVEQEKQMRQSDLDWERQQRAFEEEWRRTDEMFRRRMSLPPPPPSWAR